MFEIIDPEIAAFVRPQIIEGELSNFVTGPEKKTFAFLVKKVQEYSVIVESTTLRGHAMELPINKSELYRKEVEVMASRMPAPEPKALGRPTTKPKEIVMETKQAEQSDEKLNPEMEAKIDKVLLTFHNGITELIEEAIKNAVTERANAVAAAPPPEVEPRYTCADCRNRNYVFGTGKVESCSKFGTVPVFVVINPVEECNSFTWDEGIPF
jgi:hypothetical protein